ncbi:MAG: hypothetical protein WKF54_14005 [Nocardioidaceae bacterium]|jgi:hypothetical protein
MPPQSEHLSSSVVQTMAEDKIVAAVAAARGIHLIWKPGKITLAGGVYIEVDAATADESVVVEVYARQGKLKGAQPKKIAQDILKLALLKREGGRKCTEAIIAFASQQARDSISGWLRQAAETFDVKLEVVDVPQDLRDQILRAQSRQVMVNLDQVADDVGIDPADGSGSVAVS